MTDVAEVEAQARAANRVDLWDGLWSNKESTDWRKEALARVYTRITRLVPKGGYVTDVGGGVGHLAERLIEEQGCTVDVWDHSAVALEQARALGADTHRVDLEGGPGWWPVPRQIVVATEVLEHLSAKARLDVLDLLEKGIVGSGLFTVPNNRLGPDEEPQHTIKFTARTFLNLLRGTGQPCRVEVFGPYLLGVVGALAEKKATLSLCLPVRDEERDLEAVLASFRGVADEVVVGVDPRSVDRTREIAEQYADVVFDLIEPRGPEDERMPEGGFHFSHARNQCVERCTSDWVFMTEGHERLLHGRDTLLALGDVVPEEADIGFVWRRGGNQQWGYPWLFRSRCGFRYERAVHNELRYPSGTKVVHLPQIVTLHERHRENAQARAKQRTMQNRDKLLDDWQTNENAASLFYFAQEIRWEEPEEAAERFQQFLDLEAKHTNGLTRYQARLELAKLYMRLDRPQEARATLVPASGDDWTRVEHLIWLGDLAFEDEERPEEERHREALQFYRYAGTVAGEIPFTLWWIDLPSYTYVPAQRLAMCYGHVGRLEEALQWARRVLDLLPDDAPDGVFDEARSNIKLLEEATGHEQDS